jgi:hypothetical protein
MGWVNIFDVGSYLALIRTGFAGEKLLQNSGQRDIFKGGYIHTKGRSVWK